MRRSRAHGSESPIAVINPKQAIDLGWVKSDAALVQSSVRNRGSHFSEDCMSRLPSFTAAVT